MKRKKYLRLLMEVHLNYQQILPQFNNNLSLSLYYVIILLLDNLMPL